MVNSSTKNLVRRLLPRTVRRHRILAGDLRNNFIVTSWHDYPGAILGRTEKPLLKWFAQHVKPGECWLDIGAHYGYTALAMARLVGPDGSVFAFEPMLATAGYIQEMRKINQLKQLTVIPIALGGPSSTGIQHLAVSRGMIDSTIDQDSWQESFMVSWLDKLWLELSAPPSPIHGIKIDVQGMEIDTLLGMQNILRTYQPKLVIEVHDGVDRNLFKDALSTCGYTTEAEPLESESPAQTEEFVSDRSYIFTPKVG